MITEADAKTKWCPMARLATTDRAVVGFNRVAAVALDEGPMIAPAVCCIASACMAWRWRDDQAADLKTRGYCGAFGRPEEL